MRKMIAHNAAVIWSLVIFVMGIVGAVAAVPVLRLSGLDGAGKLFLVITAAGSIFGTGSSLFLVIYRRAEVEPIGFWELIRSKANGEPYLLKCRTWARLVAVGWIVGALGICLFLLSRLF